MREGCRAASQVDRHQGVDRIWIRNILAQPREESYDGKQDPGKKDIRGVYVCWGWIVTGLIQVSTTDLVMGICWYGRVTTRGTVVRGSLKWKTRKQKTHRHWYIGLGTWYKEDQKKDLSSALQRVAFWHRSIWCRVALQQTGIDAWRYTGHSFRIGGSDNSSTMWPTRFMDKEIGEMGSVAYTMYIRTPKEILCLVAGSLIQHRE